MEIERDGNGTEWKWDGNGIEMGQNGMQMGRKWKWDGNGRKWEWNGREWKWDGNGKWDGMEMEMEIGWNANAFIGWIGSISNTTNERSVCRFLLFCGWLGVGNCFFPLLIINLLSVGKKPAIFSSKNLANQG